MNTFKRCTKRLGFTLFLDKTLQPSNLQIIPIKAAVPIKHLRKNTQNRSFILVHWRLL